MADEIDRYFKKYFSGQWQQELHWRKQCLENQIAPIDENIGGGRLENVNAAREAVENKAIRIITDSRLKLLSRNIDSVKQFIANLTQDEINLLQWRYQRKPETWKYIAMKLNKSDRQCQEDLKKIKHEFELSTFNPVNQ